MSVYALIKMLAGATLLIVQAQGVPASEILDPRPIFGMVFTTFTQSHVPPHVTNDRCGLAILIHNESL